jgi:hypothetical protein
MGLASPPAAAAYRASGLVQCPELEVQHLFGIVGSYRITPEAIGPLSNQRFDPEQTATWQRPKTSLDRCCRKSLLGGNKQDFLKLLMGFVRSDVGGPHRASEKRPRTFVSALQSIAAAG